MTQPTHHQIAKYLTDYILSELVRFIMEDTDCDIEQAMEYQKEHPKEKIGDILYKLKVADSNVLLNAIGEILE